MAKLQFGGSRVAPQLNNPVDGIANAVINYKAQIEKRKLQTIDKNLTSYFVNSGIQDTGLSVADGDISYNSQFEIPSFKDAWAQYQGIYAEYGKPVGMEHYGKFKQMYSEMTGNAANNLKADITRFTNAGYSERDLRKAMSTNPVFAQNYQTLISDPLKGIEYGQAFAAYGPQQSVLEAIGDSPGTLGTTVAATGVGGALGYNALSQVSDTVMDASKANYKGDLAKLRTSSNAVSKQAGDLLANYKDSPEYKNGTPAQKTKITKSTKKAAASMLEEAKKKFRTARGNISFDPKTRGQELLSKASKVSNIGKGIAISAVPMMIEGAVTELTDNEDLGSISGKGSRASMTIAQAMSSGAKLKPSLNIITAQLKKHGTAKVLKTVMKKGGMGLAARTLAKAGAGTIGGAFTGGAMTALMAAWSIKDLYDISQIIADM